MFATTTSDIRREAPESDLKPPATATAEYCAKLQRWMWQYYWGYANWQSWLTLSAFPPPCSFHPPGTSAQTPGTHAATSGGGQPAFDAGNWYSYQYPLSLPATPTPASDARPAQQQNGNPPQAGTAKCDRRLP